MSLLQYRRMSSATPRFCDSTDGITECSIVVPRGRRLLDHVLPAMNGCQRYPLLRAVYLHRPRSDW